MKTNSHQSKGFTSGLHSLAVLFTFVALISFATSLGLSQVKNQKRVTALQLGDSAEGARVTIVSDSALNDYEAFRRGDRFYVKIPLADFAAASPNFHGNGFEDVRVQKVGDSVIVSFKLQPGATARVDQRSNRLDVIFSAAGVGRNVAPVNAAKSYPTSRNRRNASDSEATAGPVPPMISTPSTASTASSRSSESRRNDHTEVSADPVSGSYRDATRVPRSNRSNATQTGSTRADKRGVTAGNSPQPNSAFPMSASSTPTTMPTPYSSPAPATALATPAAASTHNPYGVPVAATSKPAEASSWDSRIKFLKAWAKLNRNALIVGGLIALALLVGFVFWSRSRGRGTATAKTQGKDVKKPTAEKVMGRTVVEAPTPAAPVAKAPSARASVARPEVWKPQPAAAGFGTTGLREPREADQDREVFEL